MSKGGTQPTPPDPVATANAQANINRTAAITQAELDRINQVGPNGSVSYSQIGTNPDGTPQYQQTTTLDPKLAAIDSGIKTLAGTAVGNASEAISKPLDFSGTTPMVTHIGDNLPGLKYGTGVNPNIVSSYENGGAIGRMTGKEGSAIQTDLNYSGAPKLAAYDDFGGDAQKYADSVYKQYASRLDPQYGQQESDMRARLAAQGITENSDAWRREWDNFSRAKTDAYGSATRDSVAQGAAEQSRLFGLSKTARDTIVNETNDRGQFRNAAQAQIFGNAATTTRLNNEAQNQQTQQALDAARLANEAAALEHDQAASDAALHNTAQAQAFNQEAANASLAGQAHQQGVSETLAQREVPVTEIANLLGTSGSITNPTFQPVAQVGVAAPDYAGLVTNNYNQQADIYKTQQANKAAGLGGIFGAVGKIGGAIAASDINVKHEIKYVGTMPNGINTYSFKYKGSSAPQFGVMAQEVFKVRPHAVAMRNGIMHVDYREVYN